MIGFLFLYFNLIWAQTPERWANALRIVEKHEFYINNEVILKPKDFDSKAKSQSLHLTEVLTGIESKIFKKICDS